MTAIIKKLLALAMAFTLALSLVGCGVNITGVSLNLPDTIEKGTAIVATPEYAFDGATPETAELEKKLDKLEMHYTSSDPSILVVDDNGNLVAVSAGTAEVALSSKDGTVSTSASAACTGWKNSPSHYSNIMTPGYTQMGIACTFNTAYGVEVWCVTFS